MHGTEGPLLTWIKTTAAVSFRYYFMEWNPVGTAPFDLDLELAVIDYDGPHSLVFPCRRILGTWALGTWVNAETKQRVEVYPTH